MTTPTRTLLVTGAAGYLASWIVAQLLEEGHTVHGTVRDPLDTAKVQHLHELARQHEGRLRLFQSDLTKPGSFDAAMHGCTDVIHTASPYFLDAPTDAQRELVRPALDGTLNVLDAVERAQSVTRVVLTSSIAALYNDACDVSAATQHTVRESDVNPNRDIAHNPYAYSKTVAEQAAWSRHAQQTRWQLITIHPGAIFGPSRSKRGDATSVNMMVQFLNGSFRSGVPRLTLGLVDVRDAALAHVRAVLNPAASGRYIAVAQAMRLLDMSALLRVEACGLKNRLPRGEAPKALMWLIAPWVGMTRRYVARNVGHPIRFDNSRSISELGLRYRDAALTLNDHVRQIVADGLHQS